MQGGLDGATRVPCLLCVCMAMWAYWIRDKQGQHNASVPQTRGVTVSVWLLGLWHVPVGG